MQLATRDGGREADRNSLKFIIGSPFAHIARHHLLTAS